MYLPVLRRDQLIFPHPSEALNEGLLCVGGDLSPERLLLAYQFGIFPWFNEGEPILWWTPFPRMVLRPEHLKVSKSMRPLFNKKKFDVSFDTSFEYIIRNCQTTNRPGQKGTWLTEEMVTAYITLHQQGFAHSVEIWENGEIVGGLYGIGLGRIFYGESMFHHQPNASKYGFITLVGELRKRGFRLIDCQQETEYMKQFGAATIPKEEFFSVIKDNLLKETYCGSWNSWIKCETH